ncbi:MAG: DUF1189 family protein [Candidatus Paceibacterota bacterium]|jgi:hypothetical protein
MLKFFKNIKNSVYNPEFYKELEGRSIWLSLRYYFGLIVLVALLLGLGYTAILGPMIVGFLGKADPVIRNVYPKELVVTIKSGSAASNVAEPYFIKMPKEMQEFFGATTTQNLVVVDTHEKADPDKFRSFDTWALIAKDGLMVIKNNDKAGALEFQAYSSDLVLTQETYLSFIDKMMSYGDKLPIVIFVILLAVILLWGVARLGYFLIAAVLVYLLLKARKLPANYAHAYRLTVHAATLPILINLVLAAVTGDPRTLATVPFVFTIILLGVVWVNLREAK